MKALNVQFYTNDTVFFKKNKICNDSSKTKDDVIPLIEQAPNHFLKKKKLKKHEFDCLQATLKPA